VGEKTIDWFRPAPSLPVFTLAVLLRNLSTRASAMTWSFLNTEYMQTRKSGHGCDRIRFFKPVLESVWIVV
jgi:hypothetical protein